MTASIVVLGATGYAGGLALEALLRRGVRPVVASTRENAVRALAEESGGLEYRLADATQLESVKALVDAGDVLVTTVGPFHRLGRVVARAAAEKGAHYVDSTGEVAFVRHLVDELDTAARLSGSTMLPAFGYDYVPGLLAGGLAAQRAGDGLHSVEIGYFVRGSFANGNGLSQGTRRTMLEQMGAPTLVRHDGHLEERRTASRILRFPVDGAQVRGILSPGTEVLTLANHFPFLSDVTVFNGWFPQAARAAQAASLVASPAQKFSLGRRATGWVAGRLAGPPGGPDQQERAQSQGLAVARARHLSGRELARVQLTGPNPYDITAELMAWGAQQLAEGRARNPGVTDAIGAFGLDEALAAASQMGLREEELTREPYHRFR